MKQQKTFKSIFVSIALAGLFVFVLSTYSPVVVHVHSQSAECRDGIDNDGDGTADTAGVDANGDKIPEMYADPNCLTGDPTAREADQASGLVPCINKCDLNSVFALLNNLVNILIKLVLFPIAVLMFMYAGYQYIIAQGNPSKKANVKKMVMHLIGGLVLILCSWVIVKTLLGVIGYGDALLFFQ